MCLPYVSSFQEGRIESIWPKQRECEVMKRELERGRQAETIFTGSQHIRLRAGLIISAAVTIIAGSGRARQGGI